MKHCSRYSGARESAAPTPDLPSDRPPSISDDYEAPLKNGMYATLTPSLCNVRSKTRPFSDGREGIILPGFP